MRWKRATASLAAATAAVMIFSGCTGATSDSETAPVTITFAGATFAEAGRGPALIAWLDEFNASQDEVRIQAASTPFATYAQTLFTQMSGGLGPDLIRFDAPDFANAAAAGLLEPLDGVIDASQYELIEGPDQANFVDGERYGLMFEVSNYSLIYNADLIETPPTTFEEFLEVAKSATKDGVFGFAMRHTQPEESGMWYDLGNFILGFGGGYSDGNALTLNSPETIAGVEAFKEVYDAGVIPIGTPAATYRTMFGAGKVAMEIDNGGVAGTLQAMDPSLALKAVPIPFPVTSQMGILGPIAMNANSKNGEAVEKFLKWMLLPENQASLQSVLGASSVATVTERPAAELAETPYLGVYDSLTGSANAPTVKGFETKTPDIRKIVIEQVLSALQGEQSVKEAMNKAQELATAAVAG